jgi:hypothetical protein
MSVLNGLISIAISWHCHFKHHLNCTVVLYKCISKTYSNFAKKKYCAKTHSQQLCVTLKLFKYLIFICTIKHKMCIQRTQSHLPAMWVQTINFLNIMHVIDLLESEEIVVKWNVFYSWAHSKSNLKCECKTFLER